MASIHPQGLEPREWETGKTLGNVLWWVGYESTLFDVDQVKTYLMGCYIMVSWYSFFLLALLIYSGHFFFLIKYTFRLLSSVELLLLNSPRINIYTRQQSCSSLLPKLSSLPPPSWFFSRKHLRCLLLSLRLSNWARLTSILHLSISISTATWSRQKLLQFDPPLPINILQKNEYQEVLEFKEVRRTILRSDGVTVVTWRKGKQIPSNHQRRIAS